MRVFLHPGEVVSKSDGDVHFISAPQLAQLYHVLPTDEVHVVTENNNKIIEMLERFAAQEALEWLHLYPSYEGNYYDIHKKTL